MLTVSQPTSPLEVQKPPCSALLVYSSVYDSTGEVLEKEKIKTLEIRQNIRQDYEQVALAYWLFYSMFWMLSEDG